MGAKIDYYDKLSHCKDWLIWTDPFTYRLLRLMGGEMPCAVQTTQGDRTYIFNGDHSFTMTNSHTYTFNCSNFYSEDKLYDMMTSWCRKQWGGMAHGAFSVEGIDTVIKYYISSPNVLYRELMDLPRDYTQDELRQTALNNDRHREVSIAKIWGPNLHPVEVNGETVALRIDGYKQNTGTSSHNLVYFSKKGDSNVIYSHYYKSGTEVVRL